MTVAALTPSVDYLENGVTTAFAVPFRFNSPQEILATRVLADGSEVALTYGGDYAVTGGATDAGGTLTVAAAAAGGVRLAIKRATARAQAMNYATADTFPAESHEAALDKLTMLAQEQDVATADIDRRALKLPYGETAPPVPTLTGANGKALGIVDGLPTWIELDASAAAQAAASQAAIEAIYGQIASVNIQTLAADLLLALGAAHVQRLTAGAGSRVFAPSGASLPADSFREYLIVNDGVLAISIFDHEGNRLEVLAGGEAARLLVTPLATNSFKATNSDSWTATFEALAGVATGLGDAAALAPYAGTTRLAQYLKIARGVWMRNRYDGDAAGISLSRRAISVIPTMQCRRWKDATLTGAWTTNLVSNGSGSNAKYVSNTAISSATAGRIAELIVTPPDSKPYDLYLSITERTSGGYVIPKIDGAQTLLAPAIVDPAALGARAISCYGAVDNKNRVLHKLASGLTGTHTVSMEVFGPGTLPAGSAGATVTLNALHNTADFGQALTMPAHWAAAEAVVSGDEREYGGRFYCCSVAGTTTATPPTHASGAVSDGTVTWNATGASYASSWIDVRDIDYPSEVEDAIVTLSDGVNSGDFGGQTHLNEYVVTRELAMDDTPYAWTADAVIAFGRSQSLVETLQWKFSGAGAVIAAGTRRMTASGGSIRDRSEIVTTVDLTANDWYGAMLPLVSYDGNPWQVRCFTHVIAPDGTVFEFDDYPTDTNIELGAAYSMAAYGDLGLSGTVMQAARVEPAAVNGYATGRAWMRMNINSITPPPSGTTDWQAKGYFQVDDAGGTPMAIPAGSTLIFGGEWRFGVGGAMPPQ